ncbi:hypothetical protein TNCV_1410291, partial [Trichonephila clavipes]
MLCLTSQRESQDFLGTVTTILWPVRFIDLTPIENTWDYLG